MLVLYCGDPRRLADTDIYRDGRRKLRFKPRTRFRTPVIDSHSLRIERKSVSRLYSRDREWLVDWGWEFQTHVAHGQLGWRFAGALVGSPTEQTVEKGRPEYGRGGGYFVGGLQLSRRFGYPVWRNRIIKLPTELSADL